MLLQEALQVLSWMEIGQPLHTTVVKSFHSLIKTMYNFTVITSNEFYSSHVSVMSEWKTNYFVTKNTHETWFSNSL